MISARRRDELRKALSGLIPMAPYDAFSAMHAQAQAQHLRALPPANAAWLAAIAYIRHVHTDYDLMLDEGYDRDSARHFATDQINEVLTRWRANRLLDFDADGSEVWASGDQTR